MSDKLSGANDQEKLISLTKKTHKEQAVWFLNAFWEEGLLEKDAELLWNFVQQIQKIDLQKGAEGNEIDEMQMHRFLESFKETMTVKEMRDSLRDTKAADRVKNLSLVHYLLFKYKKDFKTLVNSSQGNKEIDEAQKKLKEVQALFKEAESKAAEAKAALKEAEAKEAEAKKGEATAKEREAEAKKTEESAKKSESDAIQRETEAKAAQEELKAALKDLKEQEDAYNNKTESFKKKTEEGSGVQQNKAKAELASHLATPTLPLQRAKITQEAAVKKADKAAAAAVTARTSAEQARSAASAASQEASAARHAAEQQAAVASAARDASAQATAAAEAALDECRQKVDEAEAFLNEVKSKPGSGKGAIWWMQRELHEAKAFLPEKKGGYRKKEV